MFDLLYINQVECKEYFMKEILRKNSINYCRLSYLLDNIKY